MVDKLNESTEMTKLEKQVGPEFVSIVNGQSLKDLNDNLLTLAKYAQEVITSQKADEALSKAKEEVKELNAPYKEALKANANKQRYVALLLEEKKGK